jgi:hypothetical protein
MKENENVDIPNPKRLKKSYSVKEQPQTPVATVKTIYFIRILSNLNLIINNNLKNIKLKKTFFVFQ